MKREQILQNIKTNPAFDVLIVGGGINGIGTFRDLALQNQRVLLVERSDFGSGASAASSHMVHGGIRYLENGEFRLVREAVQERNRLIENAPHYVQPLPTTIPIFKHFSGIFNAPLKFLGLLDRPSERGGLIIKLGLMMYDAYTSAQGTVPKHRFEGRAKALARVPALNPEIKYAATYYDAAMHSPERIALEVLMDGIETSEDALAINYVSAVPPASTNGPKSANDGVTLRDELSGDLLTVRPKLIVNAAGPWIDFANQALGKESKFIGGTKGSHLVLDHPELREAIGESEFFFENSDGRLTLIYPFKERVMIGTSDIPLDNPDNAVCTDEEIDYFMEMIDIVFPAIKVDRSHIVYSFSGVRPLPSSDAATAGQISRDHSIRVIEPQADNAPAILNLVGGKWTTFRAFSEQTTDKALSRLNAKRLSDTKTLPIGGGRDYPQSEADLQKWLDSLEQEVELPRAVLSALFDRYGTRAADIARFISAEENKEGGSSAVVEHCADSPYYRGEIQFLAQHEFVEHLDDLFLRRTLIAMQGQITTSLVNEAAEIVGDVQGWSAETRQAEIDRFYTLLQERHGVMVG